MKIEQFSETLTLTSITVSGHKYIHALQKVTSTDTTYYSGIFTENVSTIAFATDGYYIISEIRLPEQVISNGYYTLNDIKYDPTANTITIENLLKVDITGTNIIRTDYNYLSYYYINKYNIDLIKQTFLKGICNCGCSTRTGGQTIDTLIMGIEVLKNLVDYELYYEAQRVVEQLGICTGILTTSCNCNG